jgi:sigma-B regulation protein RsbU (phosphoserine phosphatase)
LEKESVNNMFVTVFYGIYNIKTGEVKYTNAGHNPPYIVKQNGSLERLPVTRNMAIGIFGDFEYQEETLQLEHGDTLLLYTDGVTEAINPSEEEFKEERLEETLKKSANQSCQQIIDTIKADVKTFADGAEQSDDITLLALKRL